MSKPLEVFSPEDFRKVHQYEKYQHEIAAIANAKLARLIGPKLYGYKHTAVDRYIFGSDRNEDIDSLTCHAFNITPLAKVESCNHPEDSVEVLADGMTDKILLFSCKKCGKRLTPTWTVSEC